MTEIKEITVIECRNCRATFYGGSEKITLYPGCIIIIGSKKIISQCNLCKENFNESQRRIVE
jgi:hypothetical protein